MNGRLKITRGGNDTFTDVVLAVHGGAGVITHKNMTASAEKNYVTKLEAALKAGYKVLKQGGTSLDAVQAAVIYLEDCPLFNAGKGAVFTDDGRIELDASIMDGKTLRAGAVAEITRIKNPITAARAVLEHSPHVLLVGKGAEKFVRQFKLDFVDPSYFFTQRQWDKFEIISNEPAPNGKEASAKERMTKFGTVGAVARDEQGNLGAATSTGGIMNKHYGRVGDTPIIGAGIYAENKTCAVSSTGEGEYFMRYLLAYKVAALMEYVGLSLQEAAANAIHKILQDAGGIGGMITLDASGNCALTFNSEGMFRGCVSRSGEVHVAIYK